MAGVGEGTKGTARSQVRGQCQEASGGQLGAFGDLESRREVWGSQDPGDGVSEPAASPSGGSAVEDAWRNGEKEHSCGIQAPVTSALTWMPWAASKSPLNLSPLHRWGVRRKPAPALGEPGSQHPISQVPREKVVCPWPRSSVSRPEPDSRVKFSCSRPKRPSPKGQAWVENPEDGGPRPSECSE